MLAYNFIPFPELKTENFKLRQLKIEDDKAIYILRSDTTVNAFIDRPKARSIQDAS